MNPEDDIAIDASGVATLIIRSGGPLNIMGSPVARALTERLHTLAQNPAVKVLVIRGTGSKTFIGGADIKEMVGLERGTAKAFIRTLYELCEAVRLFPAPTIACIDGWCIGVGLELAASCDVRYASAASRFSMPEVKIGIPSVIQGALLARLIGEGRARWLMLSGDAIDAPTALAWGLLNGMEESADLAVRVESFARGMAACGATAMRKQKQLLLEWEEPHLGEAMWRSIAHFDEVFESGEPHARMSEFLREKAARRRGLGGSGGTGR